MNRDAHAVAASPEHARAPLTSARSYGDGVPGARRFRPRSPELGTFLEHGAGLSPLSRGDRMGTTGAEPSPGLVLLAHLRPLATLDVTFQLAPHPPGWALTIGEAPVAGLLPRAGLRPHFGRALWARTAEFVRRLRRLRVAPTERNRRA